MRRPTFYRPLMAGEQKLMGEVFGTSLPPFPQIGIGDGLGGGDRIWTDMAIDRDDRMPAMKYEINMGDYATWDLSSKQYISEYYDDAPAVLCHEMTHVWQFAHGQSVKLRSIWAQSWLGSGYNFKPGDPWADYNVEQRAQIVEKWVSEGKSKEHELYPYIHYIIQGDHGRRDQFLDLSELTLKLLQESGFGQQVQEETSTHYSMTQQDDPAPLSDEYLLSLLAPRYAANDVAGFGGREGKLEEVFGLATHSQAQTLLVRLRARRPGDKVALYFQTHLSTTSRDKLLKILQSR